ncbi:hypothetical protein GCG54_00010204 [Colletotrichum gloeosporioides]|uniref:Xylanolytic transcriptional activator regulatory domain-containing protein n=1 Tax=Colletotrichum gloeosporioides TaxID=474922 RepID=A0A8H4FG91_COLGL|nr:uncharacterized protein GCG54_00010204 [Colletotrichum gloeosporioides]KAF3800930.1 hypothetical protein GCG54_00010204 [Colletotrichum gloeosporioides]
MPCERCQNKGRACVYAGESRRSASFSSGTTVQGTDLPHDNDDLTTFGQSSVPPCNQIETHEVSIVTLKVLHGVTLIHRHRHHLFQHQTSELLASQCHRSIRSYALIGQRPWHSIDAHAWIGVEPWQSMAADHVLLDDFVCPSLSYSTGDGTELPSIPEVSTTTSEQSPAADVQTAREEEGTSQTPSEPTPIREAQRPNYTNHTELSATFAEVLGSPSALARDYSNPNSSTHGQQPKTNDFVTAGLANLSRIAGLSANKASRPEEDWHLEDYDYVPTLPERVYETIKRNFEMLNTDSGLCRKFTDKQLPPITTMNAFIQSYFEHYSHIFPMIHQPTFDTANVHWVLILAVAAIGCGFSQLGNTCTTFILQEFLRRSVSLCDSILIGQSVQIELETNPTPDLELHVAQSALLSQVGLMFSGNMSFAEHAQRNMSLVPTLCKKANYFVEHHPNNVTSGGGGSWKWWVQAESRKRLVHLAWVLDCQLVSFFDLAQTILLDMLQLSMPSHDELWAATTTDQWSILYSEYASKKSKSLRHELDILYQQKETPVGITNLNLLLLTLGIYRDAPNQQAAIQRLDILRSAEGIGSPTDTFKSLINQHYHALSLLSHFPLRQLNSFSGWRISPTIRQTVDRKLSIWLEENEAKARIVVYHAAKLLSWLRDHPTNSHHEPMALLTGTLALWMFTALGKHNKADSSSRSLLQSSPASDGTPKLVTLRLDKEIEEETLVKWTSGDRGMRPYMGGVGSLIEQGASRRLVQESQRIFSLQTGWSLSIAIGMVVRAQYKNNRRGK